MDIASIALRGFNDLGHTTIISWVRRDESWLKSFDVQILVLPRATFLVSNGNNIVATGNGASCPWQHQNLNVKTFQRTFVPPYSTDNRSTVTPTFLSRNRFHLQLDLHIVQNWTKSERGKLKNFKISVHGTSNPAILRLQGELRLWSLNSNLFFKEPHQLAKFTC